MDACFMVPSEEMSELNMLRDKRLNSTDITQLFLSLIKARLHRLRHVWFAAKEQYKRSKVELDSTTRRLENEKTDVQTTTLEWELDRRSNYWSARQDFKPKNRDYGIE